MDMADPVTNLHYAPNANLVGSTYAPGADGFNLADVSSAAEADSLPAGVLGLIYLGDTSGVTASFMSAVNQAVGDGKIYGFYLADEPGPDVSAANLKAEADYIHSVDPGAITFIVLENNGTDTSPSYSFNPANTDIDLFGLDPYPVQTQYNGANYSIIGSAVTAAVAQGIPLADIVPVYQAFGGGGFAPWIVPTASQEQTIISTWGQYVPTPAFDYAYSWGTQSGDTAIANEPGLQAVFAAHNGETTPCFVAGTRISTDRGEVVVEDIREGDSVQTVLGGPVETVVWIGHRAVDCARHPDPRKVWPVRIAADAFGLERPCRDLYMSPDHAVYIGDVLIPVKCLINETTITQVQRSEVAYYHVELPRHTVLLAEGLPVESYLDTGDRTTFTNGAGPVALYPDFASRQWDAAGCVPLVVVGPELVAARQWVNAMALAKVCSSELYCTDEPSLLLAGT
jgi:hypothetical protein